MSANFTAFTIPIGSLKNAQDDQNGITTNEAIWEECQMKKSWFSTSSNLDIDNPQYGGWNAEKECTQNLIDAIAKWDAVKADYDIAKAKLDAAKAAHDDATEDKDLEKVYTEALKHHGIAKVAFDALYKGEKYQDAKERAPAKETTTA